MAALPLAVLIKCFGDCVRARLAKTSIPSSLVPTSQTFQRATACTSDSGHLLLSLSHLDIYDPTMR